MSRRRVLALLGTGLMTLGLAGCTSFSPVYGDPSGAGLASARFNFAPPTNRLEQIILNRLSVAFPNPGGANDPVLRVSANNRTLAASLSNVYVAGDPAPVRIEASVTILRGEEIVFSATRFTDTAHQSGSVALPNQAAAQGASEAAAQSTAEALRAAILAGYRP